MDIALIATLLGGLAAVWFFWDKLVALWRCRTARINLAANPTRENIERIILRSDPKRDWHAHVDDWRTITSYDGDANLRFEMDYGDDGKQNPDFRESWANRHQDPHATGYWCRLYYGSTLIESFILVSVDGGRALLPLPSPGKDREHPGPVAKLDHKIGQIHDALGSLEEYMRRSGLTVEEA